MSEIHKVMSNRKVAIPSYYKMEQIDSALLLEPPIGVTLGMPVESLLAPSRRCRSTHPRRHLNPFILFRRNFVALLAAHPVHPKMGPFEVTRRSANEWRNAPPVVKEYFQMLSGEANKRHAINYPPFMYAPRKRRITKSAFAANMDRKRKVSIGLFKWRNI
ncbi:7925_t:CDS:1 [Paraglomus brasilianum]|uniref:7925_t:CDS:1 n=1 Tax=Paraglomus brasilianum TaxID=144538 RepID=A0A9N9H2C9_9GLOM|nr:7925_t:CDS:1 [Paraglomus brasilianum]